ncbi:MAG TPA: hypothetical protein PKN56_23055 [Leptospiraceae bacterium]|nr:hypothetical protein [Leptospiraceae bacterium]
MIFRTVSVPKFLQILHGKEPRLSSIVLTYLGGLIGAAVSASGFVQSSLPLWKICILSTLMLDICGGVIANLSISTNLYYQENRKIRLIFLGVHIFQPAVFAVLIPENAYYFITVFLVTFSSGLLIHFIRDIEQQQNLASFCIAAALPIFALFALSSSVLYAFGPLYMLKLILGFSVRRPSFLEKREDKKDC